MLNTTQKREVGLKKELKPHSPLFDKWTLYFHLSNDPKWDISSYNIIMKDIDHPYILMKLKEKMNENIIIKSMLFIMRSKINPMWEDAENISGGAFSFKINSNIVHSVWWDFVYLMCSETLMKNQEHNKYVNGLTISPKLGHSIIKIWLKNITLQSFDIFNLKDIAGLDSQKPLFKRHNSDK